MTPDYRQLTPHFAAEATGIDLKRKLTAEEGAGLTAEIRRAMDRYAVLVLRGQNLTEDEQMEFGLRFGPVDPGLKAVLQPKTRLKHDELIDISNVGLDNSVLPSGHRGLVIMLANQLWHSDSSFKSPAAQYSMLSAQIIPDRGGETEFCDLRAAYDALPEETKAALDGLVAEHSALHSRAMLGDDNYTEAEKAILPPVHWPVVRTHPGSGRKTLFIGVHAHRILGRPTAEGRLLLRDLLEHATKREFVFRHRWQVGDLVIWDNRCTLHRGRPYDLAERRELRRFTNEDTVRAQAPASDHRAA